MTKILLSKHLLEIRFKPSGKLLDKKGEIAEQLAGGKLDNWRISNNGIDFSSKDNPGIQAFFSYRNLGLVSSHPNDTKFFVEEAKAFVRKAWTYFPTDKITRIGIRSTHFLACEDFAKTFEAFRSKFLKLDEAETKSFGGDLIDVGFPMNFVDGENFFNVMTGPMEKRQIEQFFEENVNIPDAAVFVDVDYFRKFLSSGIKQKDVFDGIDAGTAKARKIADNLTTITLGRS